MLFLLLWLVFLWLLALASLIVFNFALARFFERLVPPQGRFIEVDGVRLHVVDSGEKPGQSGPPLLFLHGLLGQLNHFSYALTALFPERRVVLLDRPGSGFSQAAPSQSLAAQADLAAKVIALLNLGKPLVVGHSFGGAVALGAGARSSRMRRRAGVGRAPDPPLRAVANDSRARRRQSVYALDRRLDFRSHRRADAHRADAAYGFRPGLCRLQSFGRAPEGFWPCVHRP